MRRLLSRVGLDQADGHVEFDWGAGVIAHTGHAFWAWCAAIVGTAAVLGNNENFLLIIGIETAGLLVFLLGTWVFAHLNPAEAALGGSQWRRYQETVLMQGARDPTVISGDLTPIEDPDGTRKRIGNSDDNGKPADG